MKENQTLGMADISKLLGQAWNQLGETQKEPYNQLNAADKIRHEKEMAEFNEKGYFINEKGENSKTFYKPKISEDIV